MSTKFDLGSIEACDLDLEGDFDIPTDRAVRFVLLSVSEEHSGVTFTPDDVVNHNLTGGITIDLEALCAECGEELEEDGHSNDGRDVEIKLKPCATCMKTTAENATTYPPILHVELTPRDVDGGMRVFPAKFTAQACETLSGIAHYTAKAEEVAYLLDAGDLKHMKAKPERAPLLTEAEATEVVARLFPIFPKPLLKQAGQKLNAIVEAVIKAHRIA